MKIDKSELLSILVQFNPWWKGEAIPDLPSWRRASFDELYHWVAAPPVSRAIMLSGARQIGKTTLFMQVVAQLLKDGVSSSNILYATFDHPILKLAGIEAVLEAWRTHEPKIEGREYVFLDEAQFIKDAGTWVKHQVDFNKNRQVAFTGSALPLVRDGQESGVGRWHTIKLTTLSFFEYLQIKNLELPQLPKITQLSELFEWNEAQLVKVRETAMAYIGHFHHYLLRGGFPQTAQLESVTQAQKLLREDIIDKVLKRDMTALFGVRHVLDLEHTFLYLCLHDGGILDMQELCKNLEVKRPTVQNFIDLLESTHLIYRLPPYGYGKEVLRGRFKIYISDPAIAPAVLLKGKDFLEDPRMLGDAAESCVLKHLAGPLRQQLRFSYWRAKKDREIDFIADCGDRFVPFEVKYRHNVSETDITELLSFCSEKNVSHGYVVTQSPSHFGLLPQRKPDSASVFQIPAALLCYWLGSGEIGI